MTDKKKNKEIKPIKPAYGWAIVTPKGNYVSNCSGYGNNGFAFFAKHKAICNACSYTGRSWEELLSRGYELIPVEVTARKRKAVGK